MPKNVLGPGGPDRACDNQPTPVVLQITKSRDRRQRFGAHMAHGQSPGARPLTLTLPHAGRWKQRNEFGGYRCRCKSYFQRPEARPPGIVEGHSQRSRTRGANCRPWESDAFLPDINDVKLKWRGKGAMGWGEDRAMDEVAHAASGDDKKKGRFRTGITGLMVAVAACALITWAAVAIRDYWEGYRPLRAIRSADRTNRQTAAQDLARDRAIDAEAAMAALLQTLHDPDPAVRATAAQNLGALISDLRGRKPSAASDSDLLETRVEAATRALTSMLRSDREPRVRAAAATGLGELARDSNPPRPTPEQLVALKSPSNSVRREAAKIIYGISNLKLPPELVAVRQDNSAEVRAGAVRALARFGPDLDSEIPAIFAMMAGEEPDVRKACVAPLQVAWPTPALVPTLIGSLKSGDHVVRYHAALLLGRMGPEASAAIPALIVVLNEPFDPSIYPDPVREAARRLARWDRAMRRSKRSWK